MLDPSIDLPIVAPRAAQVSGDEYEPCKTVEILEVLLAQSIHLRDLYKLARRYASDLRNRLFKVFDGHYREQVHLVDVLIDRIRTIGGEGRVLAGALLRGPAFYRLHCGREVMIYVLRELLDAHELVLNSALPAGASTGQGDRSWVRDFAVGQVILTNDKQCLYVRELLAKREAIRGVRFQLSSELAEERQPNSMSDSVPTKVTRIR